jgi:CheY-like chemotaxis protein
MLRRKASRPSVLVVDDFQDGRELLADYLTFRGFPAHVASDGAEAIEIARQTKLDMGSWICRCPPWTVGRLQRF